MSKLFFDHLVVLGKVEEEIKQSTSTKEEAHELWRIVDEIVHHEVFDCILNHLPDDHHEEFLTRFHQEPYNENILDFIAGKINNDINALIKEKVLELENQILEVIKK